MLNITDLNVHKDYANGTQQAKAIESYIRQLVTELRYKTDELEDMLATLSTSTGDNTTSLADLVKTIATKQTRLTAGDNITIDSNTISATIDTSAFVTGDGVEQVVLSDGTATLVYSDGTESVTLLLGTDVSVTQTLTSGTAIGSITILGTEYILYAPESSSTSGDYITAQGDADGLGYSSSTGMAYLTYDDGGSALRLLTGADTSFTQTLTSGTQIGTLTICGTSTALYAPASACNLYTITSSDVTKSTTATKGTSPYNTSYYYTNICINTDIEWVEGAVYSFVCDSTMYAASSYRNVRVQIGSSGTYIPLCTYSGSVLAGSSYFVKGMTVLFVYKTSVISTGALHMLYDANSNTVPAAYCTTAAATAAKVATHTNYILRADSYDLVTMYYANSCAGAITLNINSRGAKPIYINGDASSSSNYTLPAGTYIVYYDGTNYYFNTDGTIPTISGKALADNMRLYDKGSITDSDSVTTYYRAYQTDCMRIVYCTQKRDLAFSSTYGSISMPYTSAAFYVPADFFIDGDVGANVNVSGTTGLYAANMHTFDYSTGKASVYIGNAAEGSVTDAVLSMTIWQYYNT